jgi:molybdenum cofactor guanylyltransferase
MNIEPSDITAVILAGGQGRRMGGQDKGLIDFNGKPLIQHLIHQLQQQSVAIVINANRNQDQYQQYGYPVFADELDDFQGPLAGFASAMAAVNTRYILTLPCDGPFLAPDYALRFINSQNQTHAPICVADDGERLQPVHALIDVNLLPSLVEFLKSGDRKIDRWYAMHQFTQTDFTDCANMFRNINTPEDQQKL